MGATRFISNERDDGTTISFDLVVRDEANVFTYGGGRVTLNKADIRTDFALEIEIEKAVTKIIKEGDSAFHKTRPVAGPVPSEFHRRLRSVAAGKNLADRPSRRDLFGGR